MFPLEENNNPKKKKIWFTIVSLFTLACGIILFKNLTVEGDDFQKVMKVISNEVNKSCPKMEDKEMRLDNTETSEKKTFQYNYTLVDMLRDSMDVEMLKASFEFAMVSNAANNPDLELFRQNKVTLIYNFKDKIGKFVTRIKVTPEQYRK